MHKKSFRKVCAMLLSVALMCGIIPMSVMADPVVMPEISYKNENGSTRTTTEYTLLTGDETELTEGTYVARKNISYSQRMEVKGAVTIILDEYVAYSSSDTDYYDASVLSASKGFHVPSTSSLKVYCAEYSYYENSPYLNVYNPIPDQCAGIGGDQGQVNGPITLVGVGLFVSGGYGAAAIGTGGCGTGKTLSESDPHLSAAGAGAITICRSSGTIVGGESAASIGGGFHADAPDIYLTDSGIGAYSNGGYDAAAIGGGAGGQCSRISISGGSVTAIARGGDDAKGAAIGNGYGCPTPDYSKCKVSITGADITAYSGTGAGLICSAADNADSIPSDAYYVDSGVAIQIVDNDAPDHIAAKYYTQDVKECIVKSKVSMKVCKHEHATYECTYQGHLMHCPDCRSEFSQEIHHYGSGTNVCKECGYGADAILRSATVLFEGNLKLRYTFTFSSRLLADEDAYVSFTSETTGTELLRVKIKDGTPVGENTQILYPFNITDCDQKTVMRVFNGQGNRVDLHSGNNVDYTETGVTYSPSLYASNVRNFTFTTTEMQTFAIAFLDYSTAARNIFSNPGYSNLNQVNSDMPGDDLLEPYAPSFVGTRPEGIRKITLRMYYEDIHTLRVTFYFKDGENPDDYVFTLDGQPVKAIKTSTGGYAIEVGNISAPNMAYTYAFGIAKKGEADYTINASGLSYAWTSWHTDEEYYMALGKSMYFYYKAATEYIAVRDGAGQ